MNRWLCQLKACSAWPHTGQTAQFTGGEIWKTWGSCVHCVSLQALTRCPEEQTAGVSQWKFVPEFLCCVSLSMTASAASCHLSGILLGILGTLGSSVSVWWQIERRLCDNTWGAFGWKRVNEQRAELWQFCTSSLVWLCSGVGAPAESDSALLLCFWFMHS